MRGGAAFVLVLQVVLVVRPVPCGGSKERKGFMCYRCTADNRKPTPICDASFWKVTTPEERAQQEDMCPPKQSSFCIKKVQEFPEYTKTTRGCAGDEDQEGHKLRVGCQTLRPDPETRHAKKKEDRAHTVSVCFCKHSLCNAAHPPSGLHFAPVALALAAPRLF